MEEIRFWRPRDPYGEFSNFSRFSFVDPDTKILYLTSEHYYQSYKFLNIADRDAVIQALTPKEAAEIGRDKNRELRKDWEEVKELIMMDALRLKFNSYPEIKELLLSTGNSVLIEDSPYDYYWGCGKDNTGRNRLGFLLMQLREELRKAI